MDTIMEPIEVVFPAEEPAAAAEVFVPVPKARGLQRKLSWRAIYRLNDQDFTLAEFRTVAEMAEALFLPLRAMRRVLCNQALGEKRSLGPEELFAQRL